jgi:lysophospholipase
LIKFLWENGYSVFVPDLLGHGKSEGKRIYIDSFQEYLTCVHQAFHLVAQSYPKIHLMGHSMGGLIATRYVQDYQPKIASLILSSPLFGWGNMPAYKIFASRIISKFWPEYISKNPVNPEFLSHDKSVVNAYIKDPLVCNIGTARMGTELMGNFQIALSKANNIKVPLLLLLGGADKIADLRASRQFFERIASSEIKEVRVFAGFYHEIFNELNKDELKLCLKRWLRKID